MSIASRTVVLTGGASGIGKATALLLAGHGYTIVIGDVNEAGGEAVVTAASDLGYSVLYERLDLNDPSSIDGFAKSALKRTQGKVYGLVNAAGWDKVEPFLTNTPDLWDKVIAINLMGAVRLTHALLPSMVDVKAGKIVNVASDAGRVGSMGETVYAAAKGGMIAFTKSLAREMARHKINVNCICPGPTDTPLFHAQSDERIKEALVKAIPFRRLGKPEEVGAAIEFFLGDESAFVTGQVLSVSGGLTMVD